MKPQELIDQLVRQRVMEIVLRPKPLLQTLDPDLEKFITGYDDPRLKEKK